MHLSNSDKPVVVSTEDNEDDCINTISTENIEEEEDNSSVESAIDVSGKILDIQVLDEKRIKDDDYSSIEGLYVYKNTINLIPRSIGGLGRLKTLKFFGNEVNLFPSEFENLVNLETLQVKISLPGFTGLPLRKLKALKELELSKSFTRPSTFPLFADIMGLERLTKLSVCHFSIRYLPPEIGCLTCLEYLDLSHNKMKNLPSQIANLSALRTLKVSNNKLVQLPSTLSSLHRLEILDLSNNRLISLGSLELDTMSTLLILNIQYNKLPSMSQIHLPSKCKLVGNDEDMANDEFFNSSVEMDVFESTVTDLHDDSITDSLSSLSSHLSGLSSNRSFPTRKRSTGWWKRHRDLRQRARQKRLNRRKFLSTQNVNGNSESCNVVVTSENFQDDSSDSFSGDLDNKKLVAEVKDDCNESGNPLRSEYVVLESAECEEVKDDCTENYAALGSRSEASRAQDRQYKRKHSKLFAECEELKDDCTKNNTTVSSLSEASRAQDEQCIRKHTEINRDHAKRKKLMSPTDISSKYSTMSFCSIDDYLSDGFYDAGRDRPFLPLSSYEINLHLSSREVIVMDRERDEELDSVTRCAQDLLSRLNQIYGSTKDGGDICLDKLHTASLLALFVSDHFGGSDRSGMVDRARKSVSGSNYIQPFVCTCPTGNNSSILKPAKHSINSSEDAVLFGLCEKSLQLVKERRKSIVVPIGTLQFGVCRHRALLMKYLCDRVKPQVPCELVRGYLDFAPHAWNVIVVKRGDSEVRMVVDACRPHDIREEIDPEYFYRYIPLSRIDSDAIPDVDCYFPSLSTCEEIEEGGSSTLLQCNLGSVEAVAKVRSLEVNGSSADKIKFFEFDCLGEVRLLSVLKHPCIVKYLGHQISTKWSKSQDGTPEHRILQSAIFMEHVKGGSLKQYLEKLVRSGEKHVPVELALQVVRDVACALSEIHSKNVIHRDLKSENVLIEMDEKVDKISVKLCDFDRAVPLHSSLHTCCIGHMGIPPPDVCVGTPRWMAPEVYRTMHDRHLYGLEVDLWSFGCLLLELLTLQVPYAGLPESEIHELILMGKRPLLTDELEALDPVEDVEATQFDNAEYQKGKTLRFLIDLYRQCTKEDPSDRPTAKKLYQILDDFPNSQVNG